MQRRLLLVTGAPAAGKTTLARALADELAMPYLSKDTIKESLFESLGDPETMVVEVFCRVPPEIATQRFADRERHEGHRDAERLHEITRWVTDAAPLAIGPHLDVDTTTSVDVPAVARWVRSAFGSPRAG